jgi:hypothetical protein
MYLDFLAMLFIPLIKLILYILVLIFIMIYFIWKLILYMSIFSTDAAVPVRCDLSAV